jgi:ABC-type phosphate transport system substrate-binding protein
MRTNDARRVLSGSALSALLVLNCTQLDAASDRFEPFPIAAGTGSGSAGSGGTDATGGQGLAPGAGTGGTVAGMIGGGGQGGGSGGSSPQGSGGDAGQEAGGGAGDDGAGGTGGVDCIDEAGFDGLGCYTCEPTDIVMLERACTDASCKEFDNQLRLELIGEDGSLPALPSPGGAGAGAGGAAGASTAGMGAGGAGDGGAGMGGSATGGSGNAGASGVGFACSELAASGTIVHITGSTAVKPFLQQVAQQLAVGGVYVVYTATGSCTGVDAVVNGTPMTTGPAPAPAASATYWENASSNGKACDLAAGGVTADIGISDVFATSCPGFELTNLDAQDIRDAHGPIQTMTFAVPTSSPFSEISAQAAYFLLGFGAEGGIRSSDGSEPIWDDEALILQRSASSGTQAMIAAAIGVPPARFKGKLHKTSDDVLLDLQSAASVPEMAKKAIGILAADYVDTRNLRAQIRMLAYQDTHQPCAVFPDSTDTARDKRNVRDGHYAIWGPLHLLYRANQAGNPLNEANRQQVSDILSYLAGTKPLPNGIRLLDVYAQSGVVPECAMRVTRTADGGNITPFRPPSPCSCVFELKATGATDCTPCMVQGDCGARETCSQGYCEQ